MKLSIVIPVLNSHEVLRRQMLHFEKMQLPDDYEIVIVDDGSDPPLTYRGALNVVMHPTNDFRPWTHTKAFNIGAEVAKGEWMIQCAVDHILSRKLIDRCMQLDYPLWKFRREAAILEENGDITQDFDALESYGFPRERLERRGTRVSAHGGIFFIRRDMYMQIGGRRPLPV